MARLRRNFFSNLKTRIMLDGVTFPAERLNIRSTELIGGYLADIMVSGYADEEDGWHSVTFINIMQGDDVIELSERQEEELIELLNKKIQII